MAEGCSCRHGCFPNGNWLIFTIITSSISWILTISVLATCKFVRISYTQDQSVDQMAGLFRYEESDFYGSAWCWSYSSDEKDDILDSTMKAARAFVSIAAGVGAIVAIFFLTTGCVSYDLIFYKWLGAGCILSGAFTALSFLMFDSKLCNQFWMGKYSDELEDLAKQSSGIQVSCSMGAGGAIAIVATVLWLAAAMSSFWMPKTPPEPKVIPSLGATPGFVTVQPVPVVPQTLMQRTETVNPDGSITVTVQPVSQLGGGMPLPPQYGSSIVPPQMTNSMGAHPGTMPQTQVPGGAEQFVEYEEDGTKIRRTVVYES